MGSTWFEPALLLLASCGGLAGLYLGSWYLRRRVVELEYGLAELEARLIREVKRRAADTRWDQQAVREPEDVDAAVRELRDFVAGEPRPDGLQRGKEGGVFRGPVR